MPLLSKCTFPQTRLVDHYTLQGNQGWGWALGQGSDKGLHAKVSEIKRERERITCIFMLTKTCPGVESDGFVERKTLKTDGCILGR